MNPPSALYKRQNWVGVILPKIWRETPVVGSSSHHRTWGTNCRLEHLIRCCGLQSPKMVAGHTKWHFYVWKSKKRVGLILQGQNPIFLLGLKKKKKKNTRVLGDYCGVQEFKLGICATCHAHGWGGYYRAEEVTRLNSKATLVARYQRMSYCRERVMGRGLALIWLKRWWLPPHLMHPTKPPSFI